MILIQRGIKKILIVVGCSTMPISGSFFQEYLDIFAQFNWYTILHILIYYCRAFCFETHSQSSNDVMLCCQYHIVIKAWCIFIAIQSIYDTLGTTSF